MDELKPCPFCGSEVRINWYDDGCDIFYWIEHIEKEPICFLFNARGYTGKQSDLLELWNRRANDGE